MSDAETTPAAEPVRFRPSKKRKVLRKRASSDSGAEDDAPSSAPAPAPASRAVASDYFPPTNDDDNDDDGTNDSTPAAVAARARRRARLKGMAFRAGPSSSSTVAAERPSSSAAEQAIALGIDDRFTRQTGLISDVNDRHMFVPPRPHTYMPGEAC